MEHEYETKEITATKNKMDFEPVAPKAAPVEIPTEDGTIWEERGPTFKFKKNGNIYSYSSKIKAEEGLKFLNGEA